MRYSLGFVADALAVVMTVTALTSCSEWNGEVWRYAGVRQVRVVELMVQDTIASDEGLPIQMFGYTQPQGQLSLNRIDVDRKSREISLTVWADVEEWVGPQPAPPYDNSIMVDYEAPPPFEVGELRVVIHQPDGSQLVKSVRVEP